MELKQGSLLGKGYRHTADSVVDALLMQSIQSYRRRVVGAYRSVKPTEMQTAIFGGPFHVSPKVDGELWFLILEKGAATLVTNHGKAISGSIPLLDEAVQLSKSTSGRIVIAGELFAATAGKGRPRVGDVSKALAGGAEAPVERLGFMAFDLLEGLISGSPQNLPYAERISALSSLLSNGKRVKAIRTDIVESISGIASLFSELAEGGKGEGLVVRSSLGTIFKIKPEFSVDASVIGFTTRTEDDEAVRTLLLGLVREDGCVQIIGNCGNLGGDDARRELFKSLKDIVCESSFRCPSRSGDLFTFVRPEMVVEINVTDLQPETGDGNQVRTMALSFDQEVGWQALGPMPSASLLHPVMVRIREDKKSGPIDTRFTQILERCQIDQAEQSVETVDLPKSEVLRREVWIKENKGKTAVRKLVVWKTNKEQVDPGYPAYVIHWTDYSAGRGTPLDREVRTAPTPELIDEIAAKLIEDNIKKGWEKVDQGAI